MNINGTTADILLISLKQLGATKIKQTNSKLYQISFKLSDTLEVTYIYNINTKNQYFLQRVRPYPLPKGLFNEHDEIIDFIRRDISKFKNAAHSSNFNAFIDVTHTISRIFDDMETLFLNYNVPKENIHQLHHALLSMENLLNQVKSKSTHVVLKEDQPPLNRS